MGTIVELRDGRSRRRQHSDEFKARVVAACRPTGVSIAAVALANGLNANLLRRWIHEHTQAAVNSGLPNLSESPDSDAAPGFVPLVVSKPSAGASDIQVDLWRHDLKVSVTWPVSASSACATWLRELLV